LVTLVDAAKRSESWVVQGVPRLHTMALPLHPTRAKAISSEVPRQIYEIENPKASTIFRLAH
jgi:hypothetical protein